MITKTQAEPIFSAELRPHSSLSRRGRQVLVLMVAVLTAVPGLLFFSMGAWPVVGFMGLDVLAIWWALRVSTRYGRQREQVTLWRDVLEVRQIARGGAVSKYSFTPQTVRLLVGRDAEDHTTSLKLRSPRQEVEIGAFMHMSDKASFAREFGRALRKARR